MRTTLEGVDCLATLVSICSILPLVVFGGLMALCLPYEPAAPQDTGWRDAFLRAAVIWSALVFAFTEVLSLFSALHAPGLALCWGGAGAAVLLLLLRRGGRTISHLPARFRKSLEGLSNGEKALGLWIGLSLAMTAAVALVAPPNNYDSMTYHMSRVAHWWADGTVAFYATNIQRQLYSNPLAEYMILQPFVLGYGSDRFANLVQWFSFAGCAIAVSMLVRELREDKFSQCAAAFLVLVTPICILEATSTQNDLVCAFLAATALYFLWREETLLAGLGCGLALLAKATAGLALFPFLIAQLFRGPVSMRGILRRAGRLVAIGGIAAALVTPHTLRNLRTFGNPLGEKTQVSWIQSQTYALGPWAANTLRNLGTEIGTPLHRVNQLENGAIRGIAKALGLNLDDPRNTFFGKTFTAGAMEADEDTSANPLQMCLFIAATIFLLGSRRFRGTGPARFALLVWAGFLLFAWRLAWQPWLSRLHIPFLVLTSVPAAIFLGALRRRSRAAAGAVLCVAALLALQPLLHNWARPVLILSPRPESVFTTPRAEQFFARRPDLSACYRSTIQSLEAASCRVAGIQTGEDDWEYPLWALTRLRGMPIYFAHVDVKNQTRNATAGFSGAVCARVIVHDAAPGAPSSQPEWIEVRRQERDGTEVDSRFDCRP